MLRIDCSGTPYEIGLKHGQEAKLPISRTVAFYTSQFLESAKMSWSEVQDLAMDFEPIMRKKWPAYLEEMNGVAEGANVPLSSIIAINVRTEITFGLFSDGCTALSWLSPPHSFLAQNWDWMPEQKQNIINLNISQEGKPTIKMMTEAGLIGKIGLNSAGVGVCLNAIRAKGMDPTRLPCHLGLRMVLESESREEAVGRLEKFGIASACHMLIADPSGGIGLEWSSVEVRKLNMNSDQQVFHANHYLLEHVGVEDTKWLADSTFRVKRIEELSREVGEPSEEKLLGIFKDEKNWPGAICRSREGKSSSATLFNIIMDLEEKRAKVLLGRPVEPDEVIELGFR